MASGTDSIRSSTDTDIGKTCLPEPVRILRTLRRYRLLFFASMLVVLRCITTIPTMIARGVTVSRTKNSTVGFRRIDRGVFYDLVILLATTRIEYCLI